MIKKLFSIALICSAFIANSQNFSLVYPFTAVTPSTGLTDPTLVPTAIGITSGSFSAVGTPSANPNASFRFSFVGWPNGAITTVDTYSTMTGAINTSQYYEITITPQSGYTVTLNTMSFGVRRSGTGIRSYAVRTNIDNYTNNLPASVGTNTNLSVVGMNEFFWNYDVTSTSADQLGSTINFYGATITTATSFRFYGWNSEAAGGTFSIDNVSINGDAYSTTVPCSPPFLWAINGNSAICINQSLNLSSAILGSSPYVYDWSGSGSFNSTNSFSTSVASATSSDYTLSVSNACGSATSVVTATVNALPTVSVTSAAICAGSSATLTATGTASSYVWNTGDGTAGIVVTPTTSIIDYTVTGTDGNNCLADAIATVTVNALPIISVNSESICAGNSATLAATGTSSSYVWNTGDVTAGIVVTPTASIIDYTVTGTDSNTCSADAIATVIVNALPTIVVNSEAICSGSSATLTATGTASSYVWNTGDGTAGIVVTPTTSIIDYTVTGTDGNNCLADAIATVTVNALPIISVNSESICAGNSATLAATGTSSSYVWNTGDVTAGIVVTPTASIIDYTVTGTDSNTCSADAIATVTLNALPIISVNSESICAGNSATLTASGASTYTWSPTDVNSSIVVTPTASVNQYTVMATDVNNCQNMTVATVTVNALPVVTLSTASVNLQCVTINSVTLDGGSPLNGVYIGNGVTAGVFSPATVGVGTYTITYTFTDLNNCSNSASDNITVDACTGIQVLKSESFTIYPNPTNGVVVINAPVLPANVNVFDVNGKLVISQNITAMESAIDLSNVVNGIYQLTITTEQKSFNYKIMVNK